MNTEDPQDESLPLTEGVLEESAQLDSLDTLDIVEVFHRQEDRVREAFSLKVKTLIASVIDASVQVLKQGGRIFYLGAGTSGRLGVLDASECPPTFSVDPTLVVGLIAGGDEALRNSIEGAEDLPESGVSDLKEASFSAEDILIGIAASGSTPYVWGGLEYARELGAITVLISCARIGERASLIDFPIEILVGPEVISGSTRLKSGTATKMALNMISSGAMVKWGKVYGNLMVDVKPVNQKLKKRAIRLVSSISQRDYEPAEEALIQSDWEVKTAIVALVNGISPEAAREKLADNEGILRKTLH